VNRRNRRPVEAAPDKRTVARSKLVAFVFPPSEARCCGWKLHECGVSNLWMLSPSLVASVVATIAFVLFSGKYFDARR